MVAHGLTSCHSHWFPSQGGAVLMDGIKGITSHPVAVVATAEKVHMQSCLPCGPCPGTSPVPGFKQHVIEEERRRRTCAILPNLRFPPQPTPAPNSLNHSLQLYTSVRADFRSPGGHSSMPPTDGSDVASQMARVIGHVAANPKPGGPPSGRP